MPKGGSRKGAGRKKKGYRRLSAYISHAGYRALQAFAIDNKLTLGDAISEKVLK